MTQPETIDPYLNPAYWDGRMVYDEQPEQTIVAPAGITGMIGRRLLEELGKRGIPTYALETYRPGSEFTGDGLEAGGLVLMQRECLVAAVPVVPTSVEVPSRPSQIVPGGQPTVVHGHGVFYASGIDCGITAPPHKGRPGNILTVSTDKMTGSLYKDDVHSMMLPIKVGTPTLYDYENVPVQVLQRINLIQVVARASGRRRRVPGLGFAAGRLAIT